MAEKNKYVLQEEEIEKNWQANKIFKKSLDKEAPNGDYVFYDGPPFATGTPHYGHIVASLMKDTVPRFWTMNGYRVERRWGWDCHGLPIENIVEKEIDISSKQEIEAIGVGQFNDSCRSKVLMYADEWKKFIPRMGRWVDMDNPYQTMDKDFMESIWWVFKQLWDKDLIYEGHKSMHVCPRCETTLSQSEVSQGYKDIKDISVIAKFKLIEEKDTYVLAWTTTPWTLPGNVALAVGENIDYVKVRVIKHDPDESVIRKSGEPGKKVEFSYFIIAKELYEKIFENVAGSKIVENFKGKELVGKSYEPLFPYFDNEENRKNGFKVYAADFVDTNEGTGVVHIAPAFGQDDMELGKKHDLPWVQHVDISGKFTKEVTDFPGQPVKPARDNQKTDIEILKWLAHNNKLFSKEKYAHSYPHCWRCDSPLLNYSTSSWFVKVEKIKDKMLALAKEINWIPAHIKEGRFGNWLEGARDWSISRQRYWGSVMPIWKCTKCEEVKVFGSIEDLGKISGQEITDLHKDKMDEINFECENCKGTMKRIPDVLDCWFESGSMPFAQMHYPFENQEKFEANFPAEFIAEGVDQTRCWFYYLLVLATGVKESIPFKNVIANGIVLAEDGHKMSKKLKNYPDPINVIDKYGADALRYYLLTSPVMKGDTLLFSEKGVDEMFKKLIMMLGNILSFYKMYEQNNTETSVDSDNILDKWIIAKLNKLLQEVTKNMEAYDLVLASRPIIEFVNELSTWYLRRSRSRFKSSDEKDKNQALATMKYVLLNLSKILAPFTPFIAEHIYMEVGAKLESVHLEAWPKANEELIAEKLLTDMDKIRETVEKGLALREEAKIKVRQPLASFSVSDLEVDDALLDLIKAEVNVKEIIKASEFKLNTELTEELKQEGLLRELIRGINSLRKKQKLTITDKTKMTYQTNSLEIKAVIEKYKDELIKNTKSQEINQGQGEEEIKINGQILKVKLEKV